LKQCPKYGRNTVLDFTQHFGRKDFIETKSVLNVLERAWT
jgi:hypothetical protein